MSGSRSTRTSGAARSGSRISDRTLTIGLYLTAALVRWLFLRGTVDRSLPFSIFYYGDSRLYREFALAILRGESYDAGIPYHPPLFAYTLAGIIKMTGENPEAMRAIVSLIGALVVPLTYRLGLRLWGRAIGLVGALAATFSFGLCVIAVSPNTEALYIPILIAQALAAVALIDAIGQVRRGATSATPATPASLKPPTTSTAARGRSIPPWAAPALVSGLLIGLGSLTRAEHLAFAVLVPLAVWLGVGGRTRAVATSSALMLGAAAIVIAPWTIHNGIALARFNREHPELPEKLPTFVLVSNYGALNFALANDPGADGGFKPDLIVGATGGDKLDLSDPRILRLYLHGYGEGWSAIRSDPGRAVGLASRKVSITIGGFASGFGLSNWPAGLTGVRRAVDLFVPDRVWMIPILLALAGVGVYLSRTLVRRAAILPLIVGHKLLICVLFYGYARLGVQLLPFVFLLAAVAIVGLLAWLDAARIGAARKGASARAASASGAWWTSPKRVAAGIGTLFAALLLVELLLAQARPRNFHAEGSSDPATGKLIQDSEIRLSPR